MNRIAVAAALWAAFAFVTWNVVYDRYVAVAAAEFTRQQILNARDGAPLTSIHDGFSPRLGTAARMASLWVSPLVVAGAAAVYYSYGRKR